MKKFSLLMLISVLLISAFTHCRRELPDGFEDMKLIAVPSDFNFGITKEIDISIKLPSTVDHSKRNNRIDIYDGMPEIGGQLINSGAADNQGNYNTSIQLPSTQSQVFISCFAGWKVLDLGLGTKGMTDDYNVDYNENYSSEPPDTTPDGRPGQEFGFQYQQSVLKSGNNFLGNPGFETNEFGQIPAWSSRMEADSKWYITNYLRGGHAGQQDDGGNKVLEVNPSSYAPYGGVAQLVDVDPGEDLSFTLDIKKLSGSPKVWLYLIPRNSNQQSLAYFNISVAMTQGQWITKTVTATMPSNTASCQVLVWSHNSSGSSMQYDNAILNIKDRVTDSDGDGVEDDDDEYPNDPNKAFNNYYPSSEGFGTLAFEDMWPTEGDYDFNDLVIGYRFNHIKNASNKITSLEIKYQLRAIGASISNGFGFSLDISPEQISSVSSSHIFNSDNLVIGANGTENNQSRATIIVFDNAFDILEHPGGELGINTVLGGTYVEPEDIDVVITFSQGLDMENIGNAPNNPFLFRTNDRSLEIHLPGYEPTDLADQSRFGTGDDATNPENDFYYKTANGLPWGMNLPITFVYPVEKVAIIKGHLKFSQWATSGGYSFMDWYDGIEGYRDITKLYIR
jgi:LruC domain-containing protein